MLDWKRTGKITMRCEPYLIIRYPTGYTALVGLPGERSIVWDITLTLKPRRGLARSIGKKKPKRLKRFRLKARRDA